MMSKTPAAATPAYIAAPIPLPSSLCWESSSPPASTPCKTKEKTKLIKYLASVVSEELQAYFIIVAKQPTLNSREFKLALNSFH